MKRELNELNRSGFSEIQAEVLRVVVAMDRRKCKRGCMKGLIILFLADEELKAVHEYKIQT